MDSMASFRTNGLCGLYAAGKLEGPGELSLNEVRDVPQLPYLRTQKSERKIAPM